MTTLTQFLHDAGITCMVSLNPVPTGWMAVYAFSRGGKPDMATFSDDARDVEDFLPPSWVLRDAIGEARNSQVLQQKGIGDGGKELVEAGHKARTILRRIFSDQEIMMLDSLGV